jgi:dipeptidyl aminopeptidase/acylaminoacyl peptidase
MSISRVWAVVPVAVLGCVLPWTAAAQQGRVYTAADYRQAEKFMDYSLSDLTMHTVDHATWMPDGRFWFSDTGETGVTYMLVDPAKGTKAAAFDQVKLAAALNALPPAPARAGQTPTKLDPNHLAITELAFADGDKTIVVTVGGRQAKCDLSGAGTCVASGAGGRGAGRRGGGGGPAAAAVTSPDGKKAVFIRDSNLWVRDVATGQETQLTTDGTSGYGYGTDNAGWAQSDRAVLVWSPDSKKIATFQLDERKVKEMYLVPTLVGHPTLNSVKYPLAGDTDVQMVERVIIDVDAKTMVRLKMAADYHRSTTCDNLACRGGWDDVQWSEDSSHVAFVSTSRDHKQEWLRVADPTTGEVREVLTETVKTFFEGGAGRANWRYLPASNEFLWFSEKDNWGNLYLYDLTTGKLKTQITHGDGNVAQVLKVDQKARVIYFTGVGKEKGWDPYFAALYRVNFDGTGLKLLTPDVGNHAVTFSADGKYFTDIYSSATMPAKAAIRDVSGKVAVELPSEDISKLKAAGWVPPIPITVKARDGKTDLYGFMFKPTNFDASKKYPIVNNVYPGPQTGSCGSRSFLVAHKDLQALAELGFITVCIDGMGTPSRSKAFHEALFGDMGDNTIPDQVAGMKELAAKYPWIDIDRVGIYGHSGGGAATGAAMFHFPDFFKVGISESGNHDNRVYEDDWGEKYLGLEVKDANGKDNYDSQANQDFAKNLKGHLLLAHGTMDNNVPPNNTMLVVAALIKANKDFDLLMIPNRQHGYGPDANYMTRRRWDYFVRYLSEGVPPKEYQMKPPPAAGPQGAGPEDDDVEP